MMGPLIVDEDWPAFCQATFHGVEGSEWEAMYYRCKDLHQAVKRKEIWRKQEDQSAVGFERSQR